MLRRQPTPDDLAALLTTAIKAEVATLAATLAPMQATLTTLVTKVDALSTDHVTRADMDGVRTEMHTGFAALDSRFYSRELADQRLRELRGDLDALQTDARTRASQEAQDRISQRNYQTNWTLTAISLIIGFLSLAVLAATHFQFH